MENGQAPLYNDILRRPDPVYKLLERLPYELIQAVVSHVHDLKDLCSLARVNMVFQELAEPRIYRVILIRAGFHARNLANSLKRRPVRAAWIRSLVDACLPTSFDGLLELPKVLPMMTNLEDLLLEAPDCNSFPAETRRPWIAQQEAYHKLFLKAALPGTDLLPCLRSCTLHFVDENRSLYSLAHHSIIFLHPTLRNLTISCATIDPPKKLHPLLLQNSLTNTTPLTTLSLVECDFHLQGLYHLVSLPRKLVSLSITEAIHYASYARDRLYAGLSIAPDVLRPIHAYQPNLQHLRIARISSAIDFLLFIPPLDLTQFTRLESVEFAHLHGRHSTITRRPPWCDLVHRAGPQMNTGGPNTSTLVYGDIQAPWWGKAVEFFTCAFSNKISHGIEHVKTLKLVLVDGELLADELRAPESVEEERKTAVKKVRVDIRELGKLGRKEEVGIRVIVEWVRPNGRTIPPYLVGEYVPEVRLEYDSALEIKEDTER